MKNGFVRTAIALVAAYSCISIDAAVQSMLRIKNSSPNTIKVEATLANTLQVVSTANKGEKNAGSAKVTVTLEPAGKTWVNIAKLSDIRTLAITAPTQLKTYTYKDASAILKNAQNSTNKNHDYLMHVTTVGGVLPTSASWAVKSEFSTSDRKQYFLPVRLINKSDWNIEVTVSSTLQDEDADEIAKWVFTSQADKIDKSLPDGFDVFIPQEIINLHDADDVEIKLVGKWTSTGGWLSGLGKAIDSTAHTIDADTFKEEVLSDLSVLKGDIPQLTINHVGHSTIGKLVGKKWDVVLQTGSLSKQLKDVLQGLSLTDSMKEDALPSETPKLPHGGTIKKILATE